MATSSKRPEHLAWASLVLGVICFGAAFFLGRWSGFFAVSAAAWQILACAMIWLVLAVQFHQRALAEQEKLDMTQLLKDEQASSIFEGKSEKTTLFAVAQHRLAILEKWFIPTFAIIIAAYEMSIGAYLLRAVAHAVQIQPQQPLVCAVAMTAVAFISFLISRYATGMSALNEWRPLRAGGSFLLSVALVCFALALVLALLHFHFTRPLAVLNYVVPILLVVLGLETALNVVLDVYRPRLKGRYSRAAFDSRLLGILNEPGGIFRSAAGAIDYQFGFKVSQTWFYKLLEKAIVPLILFAMVTLYMASSIVVVEPDERAVIEFLGKPLQSEGTIRTFGPGLVFKWPWPIGRVYRHPTARILELNIGYVPKTDPKTKRPIREPLLWGREHYEQEYDVLVASEYTAGESGEGAAVPVSLVRANIPVQYRIRDLPAYVYNHTDPAKLLDAICYHELAVFAAGANIEIEGTRAQTSLLEAGRSQAKEVLTRRIQAAADAEKLGVEIVFVGVQGIHPAPEVAPAYQAVAGAIQKKQTAVLDAQTQRNTSLTNLIGSVSKADALYELARQYQAAQEKGDTAALEKLGKQLDDAFGGAKGDIFKTLVDAKSSAYEKATLARATGERFAGQLKAYRASPQIYVREQRLTAMEEGLKGIRKYVLATDPNSTEVFIIDLAEKLTPSLYDITGLSETKKP